MNSADRYPHVAASRFFSLIPIGISAPILVQILITAVHTGLITHPVPIFSKKLSNGFLSGSIIVKETTYMTVTVQYLRRFGKIGHGIQYDTVMQTIDSSGFVSLLHGKQGKIIHKPFKYATGFTLHISKADKRKGFGGCTTFKIAVAQFESAGNIRKTDGEIPFAVTLVMYFPAFPHGNSRFNTSFPQISEQCRRSKRKGL